MQETRWIAHHCHPCRHIAGHHAAGAHEGPFAQEDVVAGAGSGWLDYGMVTATDPAGNDLDPLLHAAKVTLAEGSDTILSVALADRFRAPGGRHIAIVHDIQSGLAGALGMGGKAEQTSLIESFLYPKYGPGQMWETAARRFVDQGGTLLMRSRVERIDIVGIVVKVVSGHPMHSRKAARLRLIQAFTVPSGAPSLLCVWLYSTACVSKK